MVTKKKPVKKTLKKVTKQRFRGITLDSSDVKSIDKLLKVIMITIQNRHELAPGLNEFSISDSCMQIARIVNLITDKQARKLSDNLAEHVAMKVLENAKESMKEKEESVADKVTIN